MYIKYRQLFSYSCNHSGHNNYTKCNENRRGGYPMLWSDKAVPHNFYSFVSTPPAHGVMIRDSNNVMQH